jgi:hypothetical protein
VEYQGKGDPAGDEGGREADFEGECVQRHSFAVCCGYFVEYLLCLFSIMVESPCRKW